MALPGTKNLATGVRQPALQPSAVPPLHPSSHCQKYAFMIFFISFTVNVINKAMTISSRKALGFFFFKFSNVFLTVRPHQ
jgi:hypothetical protein